jgi:RsiW-degrading membrane proteinase PrsW (M82 family)
MSVPSLANQPTSFDAQTVIEYDSIPMKHTGTIRTLKSLKYVYLLLTIQLIITIGYLNYTTSKIIIMNENRESLSFKERNDFSSHSIKLLFRSRNFTMYFYMVGMFLYFIQLATLPAISLLSSTKRIMNSQFKL